MGVHPTGKYLYVANSEGHNPLGYSIDAATGALTALPGSPFTAEPTPASDDQPDRIAIDPAGRFAYFTGKNKIYSYSIDPTTGALISISGSATGAGTGTQPRTIAVNATGSIAYTVDSTAKILSVYSIDQASGALTFMNGVQATIGAVAVNLVVHPAGRFVYTPNSGGISGFDISSANGAPTPVVGSPLRHFREPIFSGVRRLTAQ